MLLQPVEIKPLYRWRKPTQAQLIIKTFGSMKTRDLENKVVYVGVCLSGQFTIRIEYRGKTYSCKSNNTLAYDRYNRYKGSDNFLSNKQSVYGYTYRQALQAMFDECKMKNNLK